MSTFIRSAGQSHATATSYTVNYPGSIVSGEPMLMWAVCPNGKTFNTPTGWTKEWETNEGAGINVALFSRVYSSGASFTLTPSASTDAYTVIVSVYSTAFAPTLGFGQTGYSGSGSEPSPETGDAYDYFTGANGGKRDVDSIADTVFGISAGGQLATTDIAVGFYAGYHSGGAPALTLGGDDTSLHSATLPTTTDIRVQCIRSTYVTGWVNGRGFTESQTSTNIGFGTWASENAQYGSSTEEGPPLNGSSIGGYTLVGCIQEDQDAQASVSPRRGYHASGNYTNTAIIEDHIESGWISQAWVDTGGGGSGTGAYGGGSSIH
jgi:hypothetical protein